MSTPDALIAEREAARATLQRALRAVADRWEQHPAGEGEEAWSPRQTAEHVVGTVQLFAKGLCATCGLDRPWSAFDGRKASFADADSALVALGRVSEYDDAVLTQVQAAHLTAPHEMFETVEGLIQAGTHHLDDHAAQMIAATQR